MEEGTSITRKVGGYIINVQTPALKILENFKQLKKNQNEAGGILLGRVVGKEIFVLKASTPNKFDKASRYTFERNKDAAQIVADYEYFNSNKHTVYIGEWHTHPEGYPTPSGRDMEMIRNEYKKAIKAEPFLLLLIQGTEKLYVGLFDGDNIFSEKYD